VSNRWGSLHRDITNYDLDNAISMQGGVKYLRNINIGSSENFSLEFVADQEYRREQFNGLIPKKFDSKIDFMSEILKRFSIRIAKQKNRSFGYFLKKHG
jgi:hypothetical protein